MNVMRVSAILVLAIIGGIARVEVRPAGQAAPAAPPAWATKNLRAGIIGTDTSHVPAFTAAFEAHPEWKIKVVAAFKGGSPDLPISADRLEKFATTIREKHGVEIVDSIDALLKKVDVVLLESVDGRPHLAQVTPVLKARKRVFVDKPLAASLEDARRILQISKETGTPLFSTSSARFHSDIARLRDNPGVGSVTKVQASYTLSPLAFHPDLYYYGIHGVEALYAVMGTGCVAVSRKTEQYRHQHLQMERRARRRLLRAQVGGEAAMLQVWGEQRHDGVIRATEGYDGLVKAIAEFFHTGRQPFDQAQTLEVFEFMTAAQLSRHLDGAEVPLAELRK